MIMEDIKQCDHPKAFLRHTKRGHHVCVLCGWEGYPEGRIYWCSKPTCPDVYGLTWPEMQKHRAEFHPAAKPDDT